MTVGALTFLTYRIFWTALKRHTTLMYKTNHLSATLTSFVLALTLFATITLSAEGTREAAPNGSIIIDGNTTTDIAALHLDHPAYNRFASYSNPDANNRLRVRIVNPGEECVYLGFSVGHLNQTTPNPEQVTFEFRVKDPNGNIVYGPITIEPADANIDTWSEAFGGPNQINGVGGYDAMLISSADLMSQGWTGEGDYYIEFRESTGRPLLIDFWDITVADCSTTFPDEQKGRVWSYNWAIFAINDFGFPVRPFNGAFYVCAPDPDNADAAFVTQIDFNGAGFRPAAFNVAFNSFGSMNTGDINVDRRSVENANATQPEYAIFLNDPIEFCETAISGDIDLLGVTRCNTDEYCVKFTSSKEGQVILLLDFDGPDDMYTPGTADLLITTNVTTDQVGTPTCIDWDGLDGLGDPIAEVAGTQIPVIISYAQGIYHFPIYDAEFMDNGFTINAIRPTGTTPLLFYDDSDISVSSGSGEPAVQLQGCTVPCHRWTVFNDPNIPGFGNLNTINSWWFSQLIIKKDVFVIPSFFECSIDGPASSCEGDTAILSWSGIVVPDGADAPALISTIWSGQDIIGSKTGTSIEAGTAGTYAVEAMWLTALGDTCGTSCSFDLITISASTGAIDTLIGYGDTLFINGEEYTESGQYEQVLIADNGCDSILIITLSLPETIIHYDLDACESRPDEGTNVDYSDFPADYPDTLECAVISAGIVYRIDPTVNPHSCTPGLDASRAMCVSSHDTCEYDPGNDKSVIFEVTITPDAGKAVKITSLVFFERAPLMFDWIDGDSGENNYPTLYGMRVLKDGVEILRRDSIPTTENWSEERYDFLNDDAFRVDVESTFKFELLGYCLVGNGAAVAAWDLDEISVHAACATVPPTEGLISGTVITLGGELMENVIIHLAQDPQFAEYDIAITDADGVYEFDQVTFGEDHFLRGYKNDDVREGLSTMDILFMMKHLIGMQPFEYAYQFIAGDVNNSYSISAIDIVELRKLLLGQIDSFQYSWRFGDASVELDMNNPMFFKDIIEIQNFQENYLDAHFTGIKIGDVSGTVNDALGEEILQTRSDNTVYLEIGDQYIEAGTTVVLEVSGRGLEDVKGLQFALKADGIVIEGIEGDRMPVDEGNYTNLQDAVSLSWSQIDGTGFGSDEILLRLEVTAFVGGMISEMLSIDDKSLRAEAYTGDNLNVENIEFVFAPVNVATKDVNIMRVSPNPFSTYTRIQLFVEEEGDVVMRFYDIAGRMLFVKKEVMPVGVHDIEISKEEMNIESGVVICRVSCGGVVAVQRLVVMGN
jgi:hypothetical protein